MLELLGSASTLALLFVSLILGVRLMLLARRTRGLPELLIGTNFLSVFALYAMGWLLTLVESPEGYAQLWYWLSRVLLATAGVTIGAVAWRVFRPDQLWAKFLMTAILVLEICYVFRRELLGGIEGRDLMMHPLYWAIPIAQIAPYAWVTFESLRMRRMMKKQARLGIEQRPRLMHRMLLWGIGWGAVAIIMTALLVAGVLWDFYGRQVSTSLIAGVLGLVKSACLWLAFFPPQSYLDFVTGRSR